MTEAELQDAILKHVLDLQRVAHNDEREALRLLKELADELRALMAAKTISDATKRQIDDIIAKADDAINASYGQIANVVDTKQIGIIVGDQTQALLEQAFGAARTPTPEMLASLTQDVLVTGSPASQWWAKQSDNLAFKFAAQVRQGVANGETNERIVRRIIGRRGEAGLLDVSARDVRALVHSSVMSASNAARLATYRKNARFLKGIRWLATLDGHTCMRCAALDGQAWDLDGNRLPGTTMDFQAPPIHMNDRCVLSPMSKSYDAAEMDEAGSKRVSMFGHVRGSTTFNEFFARMSPEQQDAQFGKKRAQMYRDGKATVRDLVSQTGRPLTLDQLAKK